MCPYPCLVRATYPCCAFAGDVRRLAQTRCTENLKGKHVQETTKREPISDGYFVEWMGRKASRPIDVWDSSTIFRVGNELLAEIKMFYGLIPDEKEFVCPTPW